MTLSEEERSLIGQQIQSEYVDALRGANVLDDVLRFLGSLGGIENCLHHPKPHEARRLVRECIATARKNEVPEATIQAVLEISLKAYQAGCQQGLYELQPFDGMELLEESPDSG